MSVFRLVELPTPQGMWPGRRLARQPERVWVYDLDHVDGRQLHEPTCAGSACWCAGLRHPAFLHALHVNVLAAAGFTTGMKDPKTPAGYLTFQGPGIPERDAGPIRSAISGA